MKENILPTRRIYWEDDHCLEAEAVLVDIRGNAMVFDRTCFFPGGGGQPHDTGVVKFSDGQKVDIVSVYADAEVIWHNSSDPVSCAPGSTIQLIVNRQRRVLLARYHTVLHILNTIALRDYGGWITGVQIAEDYSRIDFNLDRFSTEMRTDLERKVNGILEENKTLSSYFLPEEEFRQRTGLLRTLEAKPPVINGQVRVVAIEGFDAQACGGTHVNGTAEIGKFQIFKTENKGKINKRLYIRLDSNGPE